MEKEDKECSVLGIPAHLHTSGRPIIPEFEKNEMLYRRFGPSPKPPEDWIYEALSTSLMSVNRSTLCKSFEDALWSEDGKHYLSWGVFSLLTQKVCEIEARLHRPDLNHDQIFLLRVRHDPKQCMYPHSQIEVFRDGELIETVKASTIKTTLRRAMSQSIFKVDKNVSAKSPES
jgi:hypothetical protein